MTTLQRDSAIHCAHHDALRHTRAPRIRQGLIAAAIPLATVAMLLIGGCEPADTPHVPTTTVNVPPVSTNTPDSQTTTPDGAPAPTPPAAPGGSPD